MIYLVTGGARSGKSSFAESLYAEKLDVAYIATSKVYDEEIEDRVKKHQESRPSEWRTYEGYLNLKESLGTEKNYLLDCVTGLVSNIMFDLSKKTKYIEAELKNQIEEKAMEELEQLISEVKSKNQNLVLVTNEVGMSIVPEHHISRVFRDIQGKVNQRLASLSDEVYLVCSGIPVKIK